MCGAILLCLRKAGHVLFMPLRRWLDTFSASAMRFLRQYPLGRLLVFLYAIFVHLFIWLLIIRLQHRAFNVEELDTAPRFPGKTIPEHS